MSYCHVSAQIAQHADDCDIEVTCDRCGSDNMDCESNGTDWFKYCLDCEFYEDKDGLQL